MTEQLARDSASMRLLRALGLSRLAWSLRRLHCPVGRDALVLDVGGGGNPYPRANVLLDAYEETVERYYAPLTRDRPLVMGFAERMPFRDKAFDFVIASHVLEHSRDPAAFISELVRVGRAGYIETPDAFAERIIPFRFHRLEVTDRDGRLIITKKPSWRPRSDLVDLFERKLKGRKFIQLMQRHPEPFYVRFFWQNDIPYEITNPETDAAWPIPATGATGSRDSEPMPRGVVRSQLVRLVRWMYSQSARNRAIDLYSLLRCPTCGSGRIERVADTPKCSACGAAYEVHDGIPVMFPKS